MLTKILRVMSQIETVYEFNAVCGMIDDAFNHDQITFEENEILYGLLRKLNVK